MKELEQRLARLRRRIEIGAETARPLGAAQKSALRNALAESLEKSETARQPAEESSSQLPPARRQKSKTNTRSQDQSHGH